MSFSDPIADMICRINNAGARQHPAVSMPMSQHKEDIARLLLAEGYIFDYTVTGELKKTITIQLKYKGDRPVIQLFRRVSSPGRRVYRRRRELPRVLGGYGVVVISTSSGLMTDRAARRKGVGGEVVCEVG